MMSQSNDSGQRQATAHFERARQAAETGDLDGAIAAYIEGIRLAPEAVEAGHIELRVLSLRRQQQGGAKPTAEEAGQRLSAGKSPLERMVNAEYLLAKDPEHLAYGEAVLRAAVAGGYRETAKWMGDLMFLRDNLEPDKKHGWPYTLPGRFANSIDLWHSMELVIENADYILMTHDPIHLDVPVYPKQD